ncbi:hypothetical protein C3R74_11665 [Acidithiobacillus ferridurans]|uniref:ProQ/FINO family protein n=1 Tax=Acidithiobacillus ferridurans TaxID=1232575 RepID=UPI000DE24F0B|nr:ProQ/FINO family protein [Acidithiobacillus ferridurans]RBL99169.1 hypothetical protein C3R74_11665 [Acidithiobacillus ferridurans]
MGKKVQKQQKIVYNKQKKAKTAEFSQNAVLDAKKDPGHLRAIDILKMAAVDLRKQEVRTEPAAKTPETKPVRPPRKRPNIIARKEVDPLFVDAGALAGRLLGKWGNVALIVKYELPIALGTGGDLVATIREGLIGSRHVKDITATNVRMAIRVLTGRKPYLARLAAPGSVRYHLDLRVAGPVSDAHRQEARDRLKTRFGMSDEDVDALIQSVCSSSTPPPQ